MLSEMARIDIESLQKSGFQPTIADIVYLNDLALSIENSKSSQMHAPRTAVAGNIVFFEPTLGALEWWNEFGRHAALNDTTAVNLYFFMLAHAKDVSYLDSLKDGDNIRKQLKTWLKGVAATQEQLWRALMYVKFGSTPPESKDSEDSKDIIKTSIDYQAELDSLYQIAINVSGLTHLTLDDVKTMTTPQLFDVYNAASLASGIKLTKPVATDYVAYMQKIKEIEGRGNGSKLEP